LSRTSYIDPSTLKASLLEDPTLQSNFPAYGTGNITTVYVGIRVAHLFSIDTKHKTFRISGTLQVEWLDPRLDLTGVILSGFDHLEWDSGEIWTPEVYMQDAVVDDSLDTYEYLRSLSDGTVRLDRVVHLQVICSTMSFENYPWDTQTCSMTFVPLKASAAEVKLEFFSMSGMTGIEDLSLGEWHEFTTSWDSGTTSMWYFNEHVKWPYAKGTFVMQRITFGRLYNMVLPSFLMTMMSYCGFYIAPTAAPARIALAMIAVLTTITHRASVMAVLPVVSYLVWIDIYLTINLAFNVVSVLCYAMVNFGLQCADAEKIAEEAARKKSDSHDEDGAADGHVAVQPGHDGGDPDKTQDVLHDGLWSDSAHHSRRIDLRSRHSRLSQDGPSARHRGTRTPVPRLALSPAPPISSPTAAPSTSPRRIGGSPRADHRGTGDPPRAHDRDTGGSPRALAQATGGSPRAHHRGTGDSPRTLTARSAATNGSSPRSSSHGSRREARCRMRLSSLVHVDKVMRVLYPVCYIISNAYMVGIVWDRVLLL
jgi:hypothetical protein